CRSRSSPGRRGGGRAPARCSRGRNRRDAGWSRPTAARRQGRITGRARGREPERSDPNGNPPLTGRAGPDRSPGVQHRETMVILGAIARQRRASARAGEQTSAEAMSLLARLVGAGSILGLLLSPAAAADPVTASPTGPPTAPPTEKAAETYAYCMKLA